MFIHRYNNLRRIRNMKHFEIRIKEETVNYLERLSFEVEGMKKVLKEIITDNQDNPLVLEGATFQKYDERYQERNAAYEVAKNDVQNTYIPKEIQPMISKWDLNFASGILSFDASVSDDYKLPAVDGE